MKASLKQCPKCKSRNVILYGPLIDAGTYYECKDCGYVGVLIVETELDTKGKKIKAVPPKKLEK